MNTLSEPNHDRLRALLREARPAPDLPPGFQAAVWRRIERGETTPAMSLAGWVEALAGVLSRPRLALAGLTTALALGGVLGAAQGVAISRQAELERYMAAVSPLTAPR